MVARASLILCVAVFTATAAAQTSVAAKPSATKSSAPRTADSSKKVSSSKGSSCGQGSIMAPTAFVNAARPLVGQSSDAPAASSSPLTCITVPEAQLYMQAAASALASNVGRGASVANVGGTVQNVAQGAGQALAAGGGSADGVKSGLATALAFTPQGMLISGAMSAAPMAGDAVRSITGRFSRGQSKESMAKDLAGGHLVVKGLRFVDASDELADGGEQAIAMLVDAIENTPGKFAVMLAAESDGKTPADTVLARKRLQRVGGHLQLAGLADGRILYLDPSTVASNGKPPKPGEARLELVRGDKP